MPFRVWCLMEWIADDGTISEIDALIHAPSGLFLLEIKSHPGHLGGYSSWWQWKYAGRLIPYIRRRTGLLSAAKGEKSSAVVAEEQGEQGGSRS